jgi:hypothetical protein
LIFPLRASDSNVVETSLTDSSLIFCYFFSDIVLFIK